MQAAHSKKKGAPTPYEFNPNLEPFDQEIHILTWFRDNMTDNPKKLLQMARKIRHLHPEFIQLSLFDTLENTRDPVKWMKRCFREMEAYPIIMKEFMDAGHHGMIMDGPTLYPVTLDTNKNWLRNKNELWAQDQEAKIVDEVLATWMVKNRRTEFKGRIVLFRDFGFSGISFYIEQIWPKKHIEELKEIWRKEDEKKLKEDLAKYVAIDVSEKEKEEKRREEEERKKKRAMRKMSKAQREEAFGVMEHG